MKVRLVLLPLVLVCACVVRGSAYYDTVHQRGSYDLRCPSDQVTVLDLGGDAYAARGCGAEQTYICREGTCIREAPPANAPVTPPPAPAPAPAPVQPESPPAPPPG